MDGVLGKLLCEHGLRINRAVCRKPSLTRVNKCDTHLGVHQNLAILAIGIVEKFPSFISKVIRLAKHRSAAISSPDTFVYRLQARKNDFDRREILDPFTRRWELPQEFGGRHSLEARVEAILPTDGERLKGGALQDKTRLVTVKCWDRKLVQEGPPDIRQPAVDFVLASTLHS